MTDFSQTSFRVARYDQIATSEGRELCLQDTSAVYAWYRSLHFSDSLGSQQQFITRINVLLSAKLSHKYHGKLGYLYELDLQESGGGLAPPKAELLESIAHDAEARTELAELLRVTTFLQSPLYIGKALNLRRRIADHVNGTTDLFRRFEAAGIPVESCLLRYRYLNTVNIEKIVAATGMEEQQAAINAVAALLEELMTRLGPSAFVRRPG